MWKRGEIAPQHYFIYIFLTLGVKLHIHLLNVVVQFIVFLTLSTLICRGTDISKCFSESLGIRDNKSRLYLSYFCPKTGFGIACKLSNGDSLHGMSKSVFWGR